MVAALAGGVAGGVLVGAALLGAAYVAWQRSSRRRAASTAGSVQAGLLPSQAGADKGSASHGGEDSFLSAAETGASHGGGGGSGGNSNGGGGAVPLFASRLSPVPEH